MQSKSHKGWEEGYILLMHPKGSSSKSKLAAGTFGGFYCHTFASIYYCIPLVSGFANFRCSWMQKIWKLCGTIVEDQGSASIHCAEGPLSHPESPKSPGVLFCRGKSKWNFPFGSQWSAVMSVLICIAWSVLLKNLLGIGINVQRGNFINGRNEISFSQRATSFTAPAVHVLDYLFGRMCLLCDHAVVCCDSMRPRSC